MNYTLTKEEALSYHSKEVDISVKLENRHSCHGIIEVAVRGTLVHSEEFSDIGETTYIKERVNELKAEAYLR
jgi:hypothetical protein